METSALQWRYDELVSDAFLKSWLLLGPIAVESSGTKPSEDEERMAFDSDLLINCSGEAGVKPSEGAPCVIRGKELRWFSYNSDSVQIDLTKPFGDIDFAVGYAYAEIDVKNERRALLGIGSDDAIKLWLNGVLVHSNWVTRSLKEDSDLVLVDLKKGLNFLLIKVQNKTGDWGYTCRVLGPSTMNIKLIEASARGDIDDLELLLSSGADINAAIEPGLTALHSAEIAGRKETVDFLIKHGADKSIPMPPKEKLADAIFSRVIKGESPGATALVAQDGRIVYQKAFGYASLEHLAPITLDTKFRIGSITKQFTASAILKLQEKGKLSVNDKLSKFIPDFPRADEVTIHHLLTHTSGIHSYTNSPEFIKYAPVKRTSDEMINIIKASIFDFNPGEKWLYNNSGYFLLGYIVEKVSGKSYEDFLKEEFFEPLGMKDTGVHKSDLILKNEAFGYSYIDGEFKKAVNWDMSQAGAAGSLYSTVIDLFRWNEGLFNGKVLNQQSLDMALTPVKLNDGTTPQELGGDYGYGWVISKNRGLREIHHGGGLDGFNSYLIRFPEIKATVIVLQNCLPSPPGMNASELAHQLAEIFFWEHMQAQESFRTDKTVSYETYDDYVGRYDYGPSAGVLVVTRDGNRLFAQLGLQPKFEIYPKGKDEFFWKVVDAQVKFVRNENGTVIHAIHHQGGREIIAPKLKDETTIQLDPELYDLYVGQYDLQGAILSITREGDHIFIQMSGQPKLEMFPVSENEFILKVINAKVTFLRNDNGEVNGAVLEQYGMKFNLSKIR